MRRLSSVAFVLVLAAATGATAAPPASARVAVHLTTPGDGKRLSRQPPLRFRRHGQAAPVTIAIEPKRRLQRIRGFGAGFTDSSLKLLSELPRRTRTRALRRLLDPRRGIGLSVMRVPIAASDFTASGPYSYDDLPAGQSDPALRHFSIRHDRGYVLPVLREALRIQPRLRIIATPWSPPAWMKTNDSPFAVALPGGPGTLRTDDYDPLARYIVRFVEAYRRAGVPIWALTPQNEPLQPTTDYSGMLMSPDEEASFVRDYLAPALRGAGLRTRIYGYDYVWLTASSYVPQLIAGAGGNLAGIAYHCYFGSPAAMSDLHAADPRLDPIEDECSTGISVLSPIQVVIRSVDNWASTALMWNAALDPAGGPKVGTGCNSCIGVLTVDPATKRFKPTGDYFQLGQVSKFVRPGWRRVAATADPAQAECSTSPVCGLEYTAFRGPDGRRALVVTNSGTGEATFAVRRPDGASFTYRLTGQQSPSGTDNSEDAAVVTFTWGHRYRRGRSLSPRGLYRRRNTVSTEPSGGRR